MSSVLIAILFADDANAFVRKEILTTSLMNDEFSKLVEWTIHNKLSLTVKMT